MAEATLRCKMHVESVTALKRADGTIEQEVVKLRAVHSGSEENQQWAKWTPAAHFEIYINNPDAFDKLSKGHEFYVDFTPEGVSAAGG